MQGDRITDILKIKYPIFQGGMARISDAKLAASVSQAGGLGIITGAAPKEWVREQIIKAKELTDKPFGVNIMLMDENAEDIAKLVCEENVKVVTTGAGNPSKYMDMWKRNNVKVIPVVASVALAKKMEKIGADAVIAEGTESGGHIGKTTTMCLVPQVVDAVNIPVIAAGGIGDGRGLAASFMLGAKGVQIGTRFLVSTDCSVHENYKEKILKASDIDTNTTGESTGHPVRVLRNNLSRRFIACERNGASLEELQELGSGALRKAVCDGDVVNGSVMSGQIAGMVNKEQTSREIIEEIIEQANKILGSNYSL